MTLFFSTLGEAHLGYSAVFACIGLGFLLLRKADGDDAGPGHWAAAFFFNSLGFLLWSGAVPLPPAAYYLAGEVFHIAGFFALAVGTYRFTGGTFRRRQLYIFAAWIAAWTASIASLVLVRPAPFLPSFALKLLRALIFFWTAAVIFRYGKERRAAGTRLAGWGLIAWGAYILLFALLRVDRMHHLIFGFLVGFQVLASFGMVVMVVEKMRQRAEESERRVKTLEGLLPICSYCKKIRDKKNNTWHALELFIEERSGAEFSHGICPDCLAKHHPYAKLDK